MKHTIFFLGASDAHYKGLTLLSENEYQKKIHVEGCLPISSLAQKDEEIIKNSTVFIAGYHKRIKIEGSSRVNLFNLVGDADSCKASLDSSERVASHVSIGRVLNHPRHVRKTARKYAPELFKGIPGLTVPRIYSIRAVCPAQIAKIISQKKLGYPLIIRVAGIHGGKEMTLVHNESELELISRDIYESRELLLIEYIERKATDNLFQKVRIAFVNGRYYPRHCIVSKDWAIHSESRTGYMSESSKARLQEREFLENFHDGLSVQQKQVLTEMNRRIGLDVWGMDCALTENGDIVLYEANACMNLLEQDYGRNDEFRYLEPLVMELRGAVRDLIVGG